MAVKRKPKATAKKAKRKANKKETVIGLLKRKEGMTLTDLAFVTGWQE